MYNFGCESVKEPTTTALPPNIVVWYTFAPGIYERLPIGGSQEMGASKSYRRSAGIFASEVGLSCCQISRYDCCSRSSPSPRPDADPRARGVSLGFEESGGIAATSALCWDASRYLMELLHCLHERRMESERKTSHLPTGPNRQACSNILVIQVDKAFGRMCDSDAQDWRLPGHPSPTRRTHMCNLIHLRPQQSSSCGSSLNVPNSHTSLDC